MNRRHFLTSSALAAAALTTGSLPFRASSEPLLDATGRKIKLGMDNFAVRALGLKGRDLIDYAARLNLDTLFITDLPALGSLELSHAEELRRYAADKGIEILLGSWSICPSSKAFRKDWGTAEEHLTTGLKLAKAIGSPVFRVVLGTREDRRTPGGIEARMEDTVAVLKARRNLALDLGVKVAMENHAGDMTARELAWLVEAAGREFVGVNLDSGNALWTLEDPLSSLEILGPFTLTTSLRDSVVWETERGCKVQWTAFGEGQCMDWKAYFQRFAALCPGVAVNVETIGGFAMELAYREEDFWAAFPRRPASEFVRFQAIARCGKEIAQFDGGDKAQQEGELARSLKYLRETIGLGVRG